MKEMKCWTLGFFGTMKGKRGKMKWIKVEMKFSHHYTLTATLSSYSWTKKADWFLEEWWPEFENIWKIAVLIVALIGDDMPPMGYHEP